jgi:hypothetical protein
MLFLCGLDFLNLFAIPYKPEGFFAKSPNLWLRGTYPLDRCGASKGGQVLI